MTDALELELRQLAGVASVAFVERGGVTVLELLVSAGVDQDQVREEAARTTSNHLEDPVEIQLFSAPALGAPVGSRRVQLELVIPADGGGIVELHLTRGAQGTVARGEVGNNLSVASAVLAGLCVLGLKAPFEVDQVRALPAETGGGVLVVLKDTANGEIRRGVASGSTPAEAVARGVLAALNRHLQLSPPGAGPGASNPPPSSAPAWR